MEGLQTQEKTKEFQVLKTIGGSDANNIVLGTYAEWRKIVEDKINEVTTDLSDVLPVQMGIATEQLNRHWFTKVTGLPVHTSNNIWTNPDKPYAHARVDGLIHSNEKGDREGEEAIFEAKHTNPFKPVTDQVQKYYGQLQHYMNVLDFNQSYLSIFSGNMNHHIFKVDRDDKYITDLVLAEKYLYLCIQDKTIPHHDWYEDYQKKRKTQYLVEEIA